MGNLRVMPAVEALAVELDEPAAAKIFKNAVSLIEIEIFSYCNRTCWFCPNAKHDRMSFNQHMKPSIYKSILDQLSIIDYSGMITYSRYNEPFADRIILEKAREARRALPSATLHTNTNGDYLDSEYIQAIAEAGFNSINIQFYLRNEQQYDHDETKKRAAQTARRLGLNYDVVLDDPGVWYEVIFRHPTVRIRAYGRNFALNGTSRGGEVDIHRDFVRTAPCVMPAWAVYIDFNGKIMPCCNFRSDIPAHADYVVGDLDHEPSLFLNFTNRAATRFRRSLLNIERKAGLCGDCHFALESPADDEVATMTDLVAEARARDP